MKANEDYRSSIASSWDLGYLATTRFHTSENVICLVGRVCVFSVVGRPLLARPDIVEGLHEIYTQHSFVF